MKHTSTIQRALDLVIGRRIFTTCWLSASLGISIVQMRLLAQAWLVLPPALAPACLMSAWILGSFIGSRLSSALRVWESSSLACILLWLVGPALVSWHLPLVSPALVSMAVLATLAVFLGASSTAWLVQQRDWPPVGEHPALIRSLVWTHRRTGGRLDASRRCRSHRAHLLPPLIGARLLPLRLRSPAQVGECVGVLDWQVLDRRPLAIANGPANATLALVVVLLA
jgi:hypothetical protein